ncbi:hypothetical protein SELMODRAFT_420644 [Selaginella moellendorffii]|uniref:Pentacotripeptide-repeat region of PRORP domain-containing protein n=1 Tax=Selaginella moellendorffii TaxID=88036 RepID=D8SCN4_SELML|nr:hypothetical protein SELMODRAFT_420644 [Selaginella moellendorffii]
MAAMPGMWRRCSGSGRGRRAHTAQERDHKWAVAGLFGRLLLGRPETGQANTSLVVRVTRRRPMLCLVDSGLEQELGNTMVSKCEGLEELFERLESKGFGILHSSGVLRNNLVNVYGKLGDVAHARRVFKEMETRDVCSCTTMIAAYAQNGHERQALQLYHKMDLKGLKLEACSRIDASVAEGRSVHDGIVRAGLENGALVSSALVSMATGRGLQAVRVAQDGQGDRVGYFSCMTDMLGRLGRLEEAEEFLKRFPQAGGVPWLSLLNSCQEAAPEEEPGDIVVVRDALQHLCGTRGCKDEKQARVLVFQALQVAGYHIKVLKLEVEQVLNELRRSAERLPIRTRDLMDLMDVVSKLLYESLPGDSGKETRTGEEIQGMSSFSLVEELPEKRPDVGNAKSFKRKLCLDEEDHKLLDEISKRHRLLDKTSKRAPPNYNLRKKQPNTTLCSMCQCH